MGENNFKAKNWGEEREVKGEGCGVGGGEKERRGGGKGYKQTGDKQALFLLVNTKIERGRQRHDQHLCLRVWNGELQQAPSIPANPT